MSTLETLEYEAISKAFTKQAEHYDADDIANSILMEWRSRVYNHVNLFLKPASTILEINAGTGIDAVHFALAGHRIHATDISDGMLRKIQQKIHTHALLGKLSCQQCAYENLNESTEKDVDYIFSNFGGLNCTDTLEKVTRHFAALLKPGGYITLVIMPPVCIWEWLWVFKGYFKKAFRRFSPRGTAAHLEGEYFLTYYHSFNTIRKALGKRFQILKTESLGLISPPPSKGDFPLQYPMLYVFLKKIDTTLGQLSPFNRWGDHIVVTFQYKG